MDRQRLKQANKKKILSSSFTGRPVLTAAPPRSSQSALTGRAESRADREQGLRQGLCVYIAVGARCSNPVSAEGLPFTGQPFEVHMSIILSAVAAVCVYPQRYISWFHVPM